MANGFIDCERDDGSGRLQAGSGETAELARRESRLQKIAEAKAALEAEARATATAQGKDPEDSPPPDRAQRNFTDPESRIQKTSDGFIQGYGAQVTVDEYAQVIVAQHVTAAAQDVRELAPAVTAVVRVLRRKPEAVLADAGYWSEANVETLEAKGIEPFIATQRHKHTDPPGPAPRGRPPADLPCATAWRANCERSAAAPRTPAGRQSWNPCSGRSNTRAASVSFCVEV